MHVGARYYEFETGRWVQKDPLLGNIVNPQTLNRYVYCENDSINDTDPTGHHRYRRRRKRKYTIKHTPISKVEIEEYEYVRDPHGRYGCGDIVIKAKVKYKILWFIIYEGPWGYDKLPDCEEQGTIGPGCSPCEGHPPKKYH